MIYRGVGWIKHKYIHMTDCSRNDAAKRDQLAPYWQVRPCLSLRLPRYLKMNILLFLVSVSVHIVVVECRCQFRFSFQGLR